MTLIRRSLDSLHRGRLHGQASIEYLVVSAALVAALFMVDVGGRTMAQHLADMVRAFFRNFSFFISLP
jgi:hypothetical protein